MQDQSQGMERRMVHRLLMHWREAQTDDRHPELEDLMMRDLGDVASHLYVLEIDDEREEPFFERIGGAYAKEGTIKLVGRSVSDVPENTLLGQAAHYFSRVQVKQIPITRGGEFTHNSGDVILYRSIIMPLLDSEGEDRFLVGAANFKVKEE